MAAQQAGFDLGKLLKDVTRWVAIIGAALGALASAIDASKQ